MSGMTRSRQVLLLLGLLAAACKAGGPKGPPGAPVPANLLRPYEGELRVLRHKGDQQVLKLKAEERLTGECDVAVRVRTAVFERGTARFSLLTVGLPSVGGRDATCKKLQPGIQLTFTGFPPEPSVSDLNARVDETLQTPEAYLRAKGGSFDRPPGKPPVEVASELPDANADERTLARKVTAWPKPLMTVNPSSRDPSGRVRHQGFVEFEAVVGTDGRLYDPEVKIGLGDANEVAVKDAIAFWRFEPARRGEALVGARMPLRLVLRIY
jgi:hypothetical protein